MRYAALLRALNVGGRIVKMPELAAVFEAAGLSNVETFLASGNVLFDAEESKVEALHELIENTFQSKVGFVSQTFIRSSSELAAIAAMRPFPESMVSEALTNCVGFTRGPLPANAAETLKKLSSDADHFHISNSDIFWLSFNRQNEASFTLKQLEKALGLNATFRGVNTVCRLVGRI